MCLKTLWGCQLNVAPCIRYLSTRTSSLEGHLLSVSINRVIFNRHPSKLFKYKIPFKCSKIYFSGVEGSTAGVKSNLEYKIQNRASFPYKLGSHLGCSVTWLESCGDGSLSSGFSNCHVSWPIDYLGLPAFGAALSKFHLSVGNEATYSSLIN